MREDKAYFRMMHEHTTTCLGLYPCIATRLGCIHIQTYAGHDVSPKIQITTGVSQDHVTHRATCACILPFDTEKIYRVLPYPYSWYKVHVRSCSCYVQETARWGSIARPRSDQRRLGASPRRRLGGTLHETLRSRRRMGSHPLSSASLAILLAST